MAATATAKRAVFMFAGQGSQRLQMCRPFLQPGRPRAPTARDLVDQVDDRLGFKLSRLLVDGELPSGLPEAVARSAEAGASAEQVLRNTALAQPATLLHGILALDSFLRGEPGRPSPLQAVGCAGHSVGQWTALVACGWVTLPQAAWILHQRGLLMQRAAAEFQAGVGDPARPPPAQAAGGFQMVACHGDAQALAELVREDAEEFGSVSGASWSGCSVANDNGRNQLVLSGWAASVSRVVQAAKARRIVRRATALDVSAPFHCPVMQAAEAPFARVLEEELGIGGTGPEDSGWISPETPIISNLTGQALPASTIFQHPGAQSTESARLRHQHLVSHISQPVRWTATVDFFRNQMEAEHFVEFGPKPVLSTLAKQQLGPDVVTVETIAD